MKRPIITGLLSPIVTKLSTILSRYYLNFNGVSYISLLSEIALVDDFTVSVTLIPSADRAHVIASSGSDMRVFYENATNRILVSNRGGLNVFDGTLTLGEVSRLTISREGGVYSAWLNETQLNKSQSNNESLTFRIKYIANKFDGATTVPLFSGVMYDFSTAGNISVDIPINEGPGASDAKNSNGEVVGSYIGTQESDWSIEV